MGENWDHTTMNHVIRLVQGLIVAVLGILFIAVSSLAPIELSSRISAKTFVTRKIDGSLAFGVGSAVFFVA